MPVLSFHFTIAELCTVLSVDGAERHVNTSQPVGDKKNQSMMLKVGVEGFVCQTVDFHCKTYQ